MCPFPNFNGCTVLGQRWLRNYVDLKSQDINPQIVIWKIYILNHNHISQGTMILSQ